MESNFEFKINIDSQEGESSFFHFLFVVKQIENTADGASNQH